MGQPPGLERGGRERLYFQHRAVAGAAGGTNGIGELHLVELLIAAQADQQRLQLPAKASDQQQHLDQLAGIKTMGGAEVVDAALAGGGQLAGAGSRQGNGG